MSVVSSPDSLFSTGLLRGDTKDGDAVRHETVERSLLDADVLGPGVCRTWLTSGFLARNLLYFLFSCDMEFTALGYRRWDQPRPEQLR